MRREIPTRMMFRDPLEILLAEEARTQAEKAIASPPSPTGHP